MKSKKVLAILLSMAIMLTFMPTMAFAADPAPNLGAGEVATVEEAEASVTTDETSAPIYYDSFANAFAATNSANNAEKHAEITLLADAEFPNVNLLGFAFNTDLSIVLNGKELTGVPQDGYNKNGYCVKSVVEDSKVSKVVIAEHAKINSATAASADTIFEWVEDKTVDPNNTGRWTVVSMQVICEACGEIATIDTTIVPETLTNTSVRYRTRFYNNQYRFEYDSTQRYGTRYYWRNSWNLITTKSKDEIEVDDYTITTQPHIHRGNNVNQHVDGLPVVKAALTDKVGNVIEDPTVEVVVATKEEIEATDPAIDVYAENGRTTTVRNTDPTCNDYGTTVYKATVKDPNGEVVGFRYLLDSQAKAKVAHKKGAFYGYKLRTKYLDTTGETSAYWDTEKAARDAAKENTEVEGAEVDSVVVNNETKYFYWAYPKAVTQAKQGESTTKDVSGTSAITVGDNYTEDGSFTYIPVYYCATDYAHNVVTTPLVDDEPVTVAPKRDAANKTESDDGYNVNKLTYSTCTTWNYPSASYSYSFKTDPTDTVAQSRTWTLTVNTVNKPVAKYTHKLNESADYHVDRQPTCRLVGLASGKCAICEEPVSNVEIPKLADNFGTYDGTNTGDDLKDEILEDSEDAEGQTDLSFGSHSSVTLNADKTEATVTATCTHDGGVFKYCTTASGTDTGHWVLTETIKNRSQACYRK
jgi:hypothetical protein